MTKKNGRGRTISVRLHPYIKRLVDYVITQQHMKTGKRLTIDGAILHLARKDPELMKIIIDLQGEPPEGIEFDQRFSDK